MKTLSFSVYGTPATQGSMVPVRNPKTGRIWMKHSNDKLMPWRDSVRVACMAKKESEGIAGLMTGPVILSVTFEFARFKSHYKSNGNLATGAPVYPRQDLDKLLRALLDALTGVAIADDSQVMNIHCSKVFVNINEIPQTRVELSGTEG